MNNCNDTCRNQECNCGGDDLETAKGVIIGGLLGAAGWALIIAVLSAKGCLA